MKPLALDLFCGAGGAGAGLTLAGFDVIGVDNVPQPRYPYEFLCRDAMEILQTSWARSFDFIWASPPCQKYSRLKSLPTMWRDKHPALIPEVRDALVSIGLPYAIENVEGAPLKAPIVLCGRMFGLRTYRHRLIETSHPIPALPHPRHTVASQLCSYCGYDPDKMVSVFGKVGNADLAREVLQVPWMTGTEASQCVPPVYAQYVAEQMAITCRIPV